MADNITNADDSSFQSEVLDSDVPTIVDFWAEWCGPCKQLAPVLDELAGEYDGKVKVVKVNVDNARQVASSYGIQSIPTLIGVKNGEIVAQQRGFSGKPQIKALFDNVLG